MSVIEAMARAICIAEHGGHDKSLIELFNGHYDKHVRAALAEARRLGWQLVPVEPTEDMVEECEFWEHWMAARDENRRTRNDPNFDGRATCQFIPPVYRAMLAAAPSVEDAP